MRTNLRSLYFRRTNYFNTIKMQNTTPSRYPSRATQDLNTIYQILDQGVFCTIAFVKDGIPHQIPTGFCRIDHEIFIHASTKSHFIEAITNQQVSFSVTHTDGLVLAPTAFDHSFNYRSVIGYAKGIEIKNEAEKLKFFNLFTDRYIPGRLADIGEPTPEQVSITKIVRLSLDNAAAKIRTGGVNIKLKENASWCGVIPLETLYGIPQKDEQLPDSLALPSYINDLINGSVAL